MAVEIVGKSDHVKRYRKYLHDQGIYTKRFLNQFSSNGVGIKEKPEDFRIINTPILKVFGEKNKALVEDDQKLFISGIANEKITDRMDEVLEPAGVDIENFLKNRVLLMDHLYMTSAVIGRVYDLKTQDNGLLFEAYIGDPQKAPLTQQQKDVRSLVAQRLVQTVSVGFMPMKINAPVFDNDGKLQEPARIMEWELLELSVVAIPANPGAVFDLKKADSLNKTPHKNNSRLTKAQNAIKITSTKVNEQDGKTVQQLIFDKEYYDKEEALDWARAHEYSIKECEEDEKCYKMTQRAKEDFEQSSLKTLEVEDGVKALVGKLKTQIIEEEKMEKMLEELLESIKGVSTQLGSLSDSIKSIGDDNATILGKLDARSEKPKEEEEEEKGDMPKEDEEEDKKRPTEDEEDEEDDKEEMKSALAQMTKNLEKMNEKVEIIGQSMLNLLESK